MTAGELGAMRNALGRPAREGFSCAGCRSFTVTAVEGLLANPRVGTTQRFCSPACRQAAYPHRRTGPLAGGCARQHSGAARGAWVPMTGHCDRLLAGPS